MESRSVAGRNPSCSRYYPKTDHKGVQCRLLLLSSQAENRLLTFGLGLQLRSVGRKRTRNPQLSSLADFFQDVLTLMIRDTAANADRKKIGPLCRLRFSIMQYYLKNNTNVFQNLCGIHFYFLPIPANQANVRVERSTTFSFVSLGLVFRILPRRSSYFVKFLSLNISEFQRI